MTALEQLIAYGLEFNRFIETWRTPAGLAVFEFFTVLGSSKGYFILIPLIYWLFSGPLGLRLLYGILANHLLNHLLKEGLELKRPLQEGSITSALDHIESYSFPSGHAQASAFFSVYLWLKYPRKRTLFASIFFAFMVGFSRIYLGVHFFFDVLGGWLIGGTAAWVFFRFADRVEHWESSLNGKTLMAILAGFLVLIAVLPTEEAAGMTGGLFGTILGSAGGRRYPDGHGWAKRIGLGLFGFLGAVFLFLLIKSTDRIAFFFILYALTTFWVSGAVPRAADLLSVRSKT